jgi:NAD+ synthase
MINAERILRIDCQKAEEGIKGYLRRLVSHFSAEGVMIGLSGGIDSAVLATLAVRALGGEKVSLSYLYDRDNERDSREKAEHLASWLGLKLKVTNIEPAMRQKGIYQNWVARLTSFSTSLNQSLIKLYQKLFRNSPFFFTLIKEDKKESDKIARVFLSGVRTIEKSFNLRHIYRREVLEREAKRKSLLLLGATNRTEYEIGWFVKGGIDDLPFSPLSGLYKTQIRQLAQHLSLPAEIKNQTPTPDMMKGITDELVLGITYDKIDIILDGISRFLSDEEISHFGVTQEEISYVRTLNHLSAWKRGEPKNPPVDGSIRGGLRVLP